MTLNFNQLYYFYVFVRESSVSGAARKLRISQPALSAQLRRFEWAVGEPLLIRRGRGLELSERGRLVYGYARQMFSIGQELVRELSGSGAAESAAPELHVGVCSEVEPRFALRALAPLLEPESPGGRGSPAATLVTGSHQALSAMLRGRLLDLLLTVEPVAQDSVEVVSQLRLPVRLLAPRSFARLWKGSRFLERNLLGALKLFDIGYVLPATGLRLRAEADRFLSEHNVAPKALVESADPAMLVQSIATCPAVALLPEAYAEEELRRKRLLAFGPASGLWCHTLYLLARPSPRLEPRLRQFAEHNKK